MFSLETGKLIRLREDGSEEEVIRTKQSKLTFGTSLLADYVIDNSNNALPELSFEISTDNCGRVSKFISVVPKIQKNYTRLVENNGFFCSFFYVVFASKIVNKSI